MASAPTQMRIFVSHSSADNSFCESLVRALKARGADVWYDQQHLRGGKLLDAIVHELKTRPIFIPVISEEALASDWVRSECNWAWRYYLRDRTRTILPVVVHPVPQALWDDLPYIDEFTRIEGANNQPYPEPEAIERTLTFLALPLQSLQSQQPTANETTRSLLSRGRAFLAAKRYDLALPVLEQAVRQSPRSYQALMNWGYALSGLGQEDEARIAFFGVTVLRPNNPEAWYSLGLSLDRLREYGEALEALDRAVELDPTFAAAWSERGLALGNLDRGQEALQSQETALSLDGEDPDYWDNKGVALAQLQRYKEAIVAWDKALALNPRHANAWSNKGLALYRIRRDKEALAAYDQSLALDPGVADAWHNKGVVLFASKRYQDALVTFERAIALDDEDPESWYWKANALFALKRYEEALEAIEEAILCDEARGPKWAAMYWGAKAECLAKLGRKTEAEEARKQAKAMEPSK